MKKTKAQATVEFLMTYGWAILIIIVAVIALTYFGILSPDFLRERCLPAAGIKCLEHKAEQYRVTLNLENNLEDAIVINTIELEDEKNCDIATFNMQLEPQQSSAFIISCKLVKGNLVSSKLKIIYDQVNISQDLINSGTLNTKVR